MGQSWVMKRRTVARWPAAGARGLSGWPLRSVMRDEGAVVGVARGDGCAVHEHRIEPASKTKDNRRRDGMPYLRRWAGNCYGGGGWGDPTVPAPLPGGATLEVVLVQ